MSPTIFDASQNEQQARRDELEQEIEVQKELARQKASNSLPAREEALPQVAEPQTLSSDIPNSIPEQESMLQEQAQQAQSTTESVESPTAPATEQPTEENDSMSNEPQALPEGTPENPVHVQVDKAQQPEINKAQRDPEEYSELLRTEKPTRNPLAALAIRPQNTYFDSQHDKEEILMVLRQHPVVNFGWMALSFVLIILPFTLFPLLPLFSLVPDRFQFFALIGWYLLVLAYMIESFLYWYFNIYIITDERIVDVDFYSLIYRSLSSAKIENIQDTTATTKGVLGAVFNYGDVTIQTAAEKREFEFLSVPQPATVTKFLNELILEEEREKLEGRIM